MKKKISLLLCVLMTMLCFVGCSGGTEAALSDEDKETMLAQSEVLFLFCTDVETVFQNQVTEEEFDQYIEDASEFQLNSSIASWGLKVSEEDFKTILKSWDAALDECGEFVSAEEFQVSEDGTKVSLETKFEKEGKVREATVVFSFDSKLNVTSMDVSAKYSTGEIMGKAGMNTLLGMGTVFAVLIFLAFLIYLMKFIPQAGEWFKSLFKKEDSVSAILAKDEEDEDDAEELADDLELIAVITAAIAAQEGTTIDGFVVRSIRRRPSNNWN